MDARQPVRNLGSHRASRRTVLKRSGQLGAVVTGVAASGGIGSIIASAKAPAVLQDNAPSGKVRFLVYGEAAEDSDVPIGTIRSRVSRARADLLDALGENGRGAVAE